MRPSTGRPLRESELVYLAAHRVGRLATIDPRGRPHVVPICYTILDDTIVMSLDDKPKSVAPRSLQRVRNIESRPEVALVVDDYSEDWQQLSWVMARGRANLVEAGQGNHVDAIQLLRVKYPQYLTMAIEQRPVVQISAISATSWSWNGSLFPAN